MLSLISICSDFSIFKYLGMVFLRYRVLVAKSTANNFAGKVSRVLLALDHWPPADLKYRLPLTTAFSALMVRMLKSTYCKYFDFLTARFSLRSRILPPPTNWIKRSLEVACGGSNSSLLIGL